ncbi:stage II sporulation protein AA (anti-sigma F factor antagonist) [Streptomyces sp. SAI-133]|nr:stage II sporulation protein AA (anti-sigma F factor antagonist) [Streptomyces sp. SAI-041]MDH6584475.1 stage II sporulation protein AA (anti-sigma F factor antagonist) [Streptomyces sp. SAI-133]
MANTTCSARPPVHPAGPVGQKHSHRPLNRGRSQTAEETVTDIEQAEGPERLSVEQRSVDGVHVVTVRGEIDHATNGALHEALFPEDGASAPARIVVDLSDVTFMDSSGINALLAAHQRASDAQGWLRIAGAQRTVARLLNITGIGQVISCHPSVEQALHT